MCIFLTLRLRETRLGIPTPLPQGDIRAQGRASAFTLARDVPLQKR